MPRGRAAGGVMMALSLCAVHASAQQEPRNEPKKSPPAPSASAARPDAELLEFLGSFDTEDREWVEYLTETDVARAAVVRPARVAPEVKKDD